ncbi:hypothetical protein H6P81_013833 [Aristolochia fimbriata]|uniref:Uncharacterized protein n=1 Tax=Aristolochia fimbriata TaxID=158543 RepID=A0AAV7EFU1_ARIFI|nr:hypothetical protein H6P81_013833 [Aristolochia fimbriata]
MEESSKLKLKWPAKRAVNSSSSAFFLQLSATTFSLDFFRQRQQPGTFRQLYRISRFISRRDISSSNFSCWISRSPDSPQLRPTPDVNSDVSPTPPDLLRNGVVAEQTAEPMGGRPRT